MAKKKKFQKTKQPTQTTPKKQSSTILNLLLIIFGVIFIAQGVVNTLVSYTTVTVPPWLLSTLGSTTEAQALLGAVGWANIALGAWALISGLALFAEEEWAMGQALVIFSLIAVNSIPMAITNILAGDWGVVYTYIYILGGLVGVLGFFYLLITSRRYS